jgi:hypothetical protein
VPTSQDIEELRVEIAALRLTLRAVTAFVLMGSDRPMMSTLSDVREVVAKMSPEYPISDLDLDLHKKAYAVAARRAQELLQNIGSLVAPRRPTPPAT